MRIINIVDRLDRVNFGVWNAAIATAGELKRQFGVDSEIWFPGSTNEAGEDELNGALPRPLERLDGAALKEMVRLAALDPARDVIVTHGCWQCPTRWGRILKEEGFSWMAVPHGMLEKWSVSQKRIRKWLYFHLIEKRSLQLADCIRAVGKPEYRNLQKHFARQLVRIPNGVPGQIDPPVHRSISDGATFLFMARLHHKKGILELVEGWAASPLSTSPRHRLKIAGPDDGELSALRTFLGEHPELVNVEYLGGVYGEAKKALLEQCHFYILPSQSEGFPTSVLEAMQQGLVPIISEGCNFPEALDMGIAMRVEPSPESVSGALAWAFRLTNEDWHRRSAEGNQLVEQDYTLEVVANRQHEVFKQMLGS
jgi:glycosyltransferase involved in cell wall biosynthesis